MATIISDEGYACGSIDGDTLVVGKWSDYGEWIAKQEPVKTALANSPTIVPNRVEVEDGREIEFYTPHSDPISDGIVLYEPLAKGFRLYAYTWEHLGTGKSGLRFMACRRIGDALALVRHWNRDPRWSFKLYERAEGR